MSGNLWINNTKSQHAILLENGSSNAKIKITQQKCITSTRTGSLPLTFLIFCRDISTKSLNSYAAVKLIIEVQKYTTIIHRMYFQHFHSTKITCYNFYISSNTFYIKQLNLLSSSVKCKNSIGNPTSFGKTINS